MPSPAAVAGRPGLVPLRPNVQRENEEDRTQDDEDSRLESRLADQANRSRNQERDSSHQVHPRPRTPSAHHRLPCDSSERSTPSARGEGPTERDDRTGPRHFGPEGRSPNARICGWADAVSVVVVLGERCPSLVLPGLEGHVIEVGDTDAPFTIQSMSKPFTFALALTEFGGEKVYEHTGVEPSGDDFNSVVLDERGVPFNPMVNAGAIAMTGLLCTVHGDDTFEFIRDSYSTFAGTELRVDRSTFKSELGSADRNLAIAHLLHGSGIIDDVDQTVETYTRQCSIEVTATQLATMATTLANMGTDPTTNLSQAGCSPASTDRWASLRTHRDSTSEATACEASLPASAWPRTSACTSSTPRTTGQQRWDHEEQKPRHQHVKSPRNNRMGPGHRRRR